MSVTDNINVSLDERGPSVIRIAQRDHTGFELALEREDPYLLDAEEHAFDRVLRAGCRLPGGSIEVVVAEDELDLPDQRAGRPRDRPARTRGVICADGPTPLGGSVGQRQHANVDRPAMAPYGGLWRRGRCALRGASAVLGSAGQPVFR